MEKRTLFALLGVIGLGAVAALVLRSPEKGQRQGPPPRPVPEVKTADVTRLEVTNEQQAKTVLEKTGNEWRIKEPADHRADQAAVKQLLEGLDKLAFLDVASEAVDKQNELGVAEGKSPRVVAKNGDKTLIDFYLGKSIGSYTMLRPAGKNETWSTNGFATYLIAKDNNGWRDHVIFDFPAADIEQLSIEAPGQKLVLAKEAKDKDKPGPDKWALKESKGLAPKKQSELDSAQIQAVTNGIATLRASDFADDKKRADVEGKGSAVSLRALVKGTTHTLFVGDQKGDDIFVATADSPQVYKVKRFSMDHLMRRPIDYRDKTIVKAPESELVALEITADGGTTSLVHNKDKWTAQKGAIDESKVKSVVGAFENFAADGFSDVTDAKTTGLKKPTGMAVLHLKDKSTVRLAVGGSFGDEYYVQKIGVPDVFLVKKFTVDRWLKKPADLAAGGEASKKTAKK